MATVEFGVEVNAWKKTDFRFGFWRGRFTTTLLDTRGLKREALEESSRDVKRPS